MALIRWRPKELDPLKELLEFHKEVSSIFDTSFGDLPDRLFQEGTWLPNLDISEDKNNFIVKVDLPGLKQEDIDISVSGNILTIKGERKKEEESKDKNYYRRERFYGIFSRSISLPNYVDTNKIEASYKDGVLEVLIPKTEVAKPKQIKVKVK